ncbi:MAG: glycosyltransferase [Rhodospirillales bacterium]|nr:glycosyltransferase [Rhodospirillales bacterium]
MEPSPSAPAISVCICTHDRAAYVRACLHALRRQTAPPTCFEVLLIDSASAPAEAAALARMDRAMPGLRRIRLDQPGVSRARNAGAQAARAPYIAYIDDDAVPAADWIARILDALGEHPDAAVLGGRILPLWEAPLPGWWPASLRGVLSLIEWEGQGEFRSADLPAGLAPYSANMVVAVAPMRALGGFSEAIGRIGSVLLSDEEVQLAWRLQDHGYAVRYDSRILVHHRIQAGRLDPAWLLERLFWQGASAVVTARLLGRAGGVWRAVPRRAAVALLCAPAALLGRHSTRLIGLRWRLAYALGFLRVAFGWQVARAAAEAHAARHPARAVAANAAPLPAGD